MCGIAGFFHPESGLPPEAGQTLERMAEVMRHRGPDDGAIYVGRFGGFAFRRLAVIDLAGGMQPMRTPDGRYVIVFNGEIYNFRELRQELESLDHRFRTRSDTEVILAGYTAWGTDVVARLRGMFAFALLDTAENRLFLARDHTGIKPLYYTLIEGCLVFASEIKAILRFPGIHAEVNYERLPRHMSFLWVPPPDTLFRNIFVLEPAHTLEYDSGGLRKRCYWQPDLVTQDSLTREGEWVERLDAELERVVREQLVSDVPLGALLSGGVDSSAVVAMMNRVGPGPVTTYTTGFESADLRADVIRSDVEYARIAARQLRVDYNELILKPDVVSLLPKLVWHMDEPVADPAAVTTFLICQAVKPRCTVMLTGVGADEIFGGYPRYRASLLAGIYRRTPAWLRLSTLEAWLKLLSGGRNRWVRNAKKFVKSASLPFREGYYGYLTYYSREELERLLVTELCWEVIFGRHDEHWADGKNADRLQTMMNLDLKTFLPNLNLLYTDKMSSAAAVEVRVPFLDHLLIEQVARIPSRLKIKGSIQKYIFKKMAARFLPREIAWRKKAGFGAPIGAWLRGAAREMMLDLLSPGTIKRRGYFHYPAIEKIIADHLSGREYNANQLWQLMVLELWHQLYIDGKQNGL